MTKAQAEYEADVAKHPNYHDGTPRKAWSDLGSIEQWSWGRFEIIEDGDCWYQA